MGRSESGIIKKNIVFNVFRTLLNVAYPIISFSYVARVLTVDDMGSVTFARNYVSYFTLIAALGVTFYGVREGARVAKDKQKFSKLFWEINIINFMAMVVAYVLFFGSFLVTDRLDAYHLLMMISATGILLCGLSNEWVLSSYEQYKYLAIRTLIIQLVCIGLIILTIRHRDDYVKYCAILLISSYGSTVFNWIYIIKAKIVSWVPLRELNLTKHLKPIFILFAMLVSIDLYTMLDTTMLGFIKGDYEVGIYNAAIKIPRLVNSVIASVGAVLVPRLSYYFDIDREHFQRLVYKAQDFIILVTVPAFVGILSTASEVVGVFAGSQYGDAIITTRILAALTLVIPISVLFNNQIFIPMRREILVLKSTCVGAAVNLTLNAFLIPKFAENGAAVASVIAELSVMLVCLYHVKKELSTQVVWKKYLRAAITSLCIIFITVIVNMIIHNIYIRLGVIVILCVLAYALLNVRVLKQMLAGRK